MKHQAGDRATPIEAGFIDSHGIPLTDPPE